VFSRYPCNIKKYSTKIQIKKTNCVMQLVFYVVLGGVQMLYLGRFGFTEMYPLKCV